MTFHSRPAVPAPFVIDAAHLARQREFSERTFGPGKRTEGVIDHIKKEFVEIKADPEDLGEWVDVIILGFDGAWRAGHEPQAILDAIVAKQTRNEGHEWPDWRTADPGKAIEHVREAADRSMRDAVVEAVLGAVDAASLDEEPLPADPVMAAVARVAIQVQHDQWRLSDVKIAYDEGEKIGATHMLVAFDDFDRANYPVYVMPGQDPKNEAPAGERVDECYRYSLGWETQAREHRAEHWEFDVCGAVCPDRPAGAPETTCTYPKDHLPLSFGDAVYDHGVSTMSVFWTLSPTPDEE